MPEQAAANPKAKVTLESTPEPAKPAPGMSLAEALAQKGGPELDFEFDPPKTVFGFKPVDFDE